MRWRWRRGEQKNEDTSEIRQTRGVGVGEVFVEVTEKKQAPGSFLVFPAG
jgi:hypothetical protein